MKSKVSFKEEMTKVVPDFASDNQIQFLIVILIGFLSIIYVLYKFFGSKSKKDVVAFLGLCDSGKTHLVSQLCYNTEVLTVTSLKETSASYTLQNNKKILLYDVPGHDRIRYTAFNKVKNQCKALIFVLDAATIQRDIRDVAEFQYNLFCDESVQNGRPAVLIVCNKQDLIAARGAELIKNSLEKEINLLRVTKSNQLQSLGGGSVNNKSFLGRSEEDFEFSHLKHLKVSFIESVAKEGSQLDELKNWIESVA